MKHFDIKCFSFHKGLLMALLVALQSVVVAQVTLSLQYKEKNNVTTMPTGSTATMQLDYSISSTTGNASGVKIEVAMPDHVLDVTSMVGTTHAPITNFVFNGTVGAKKLTITFINPVPSGSTGVLEFGMRCQNFTIPNNTILTTTATLTATGGYTSGAKTNNITLTAIPRICGQKILFGGGALNTNTTYRITVSTDGNGLNASLGTIVPKDIVLKDSLPVGATFVSANVYRIDGNTLVGTGTVSGNVVTATIPDITMRGLTYYGSWEAHAYYIDITVSYNTPTFSNGSTVTNKAMLTYTPHGGSTPANVHDGFTVGTCTSDLKEVHTLSNTSISVNLSKSGGGGNFYPGNLIYYQVNFENNSNVGLNNVEIIDSIPSNLRIDQNVYGYSGVRWDDWTKLDHIEYQTNTTGTTWISAPIATSYYDVLPILPSGQYFTKLKFVLKSPFPSNSSLSGYNQIYLKGAYEPIAAENVTNCLVWSSTTAGIPSLAARTACNSTATLQPRATTSKVYYYIRQTPSCQSPLTIGQNLTFSGTYVADQGFAHVENPVCAMLIPSGYQFVSQSFTVGTSGLPTAPTLQIIPNYLSVGGVMRDLYRWTFPNGTTLNYGKEFTVNATVQVTATMTGGTNYTVDWLATAANASINHPEYSYGDITDTGDWDLDGNTTEVFQRTNSNYYGFTCMVSATASMESIKWVKGQLDNQYTRYPETGTTVPGGNADYKLIVKNTGNIPMKEIKIIDILPYLSDEGVIDLSARQTQWRPNLAGTITAPPGGTIYYSTTGNPCRDEVKPSAASSPFPTGCVTPNWSTTPPPDITKVQSIKIDFGATVLNPTDSLVFSWPMRAPVTAPTNNEIAWNSFGFVATRTDNDQPLLAAEPIKVGIKVQQPSPALYGNRVWFDTNQNGLQDVGENGVDGIMVRLYRALGGSPAPATDPLVNFTVTGNGGLYSFPNLPAGNYYAIFHGITQYQLSTANVGSDDAIDSDGTTTVYSGQAAAITSITTLVVGEEDNTWDLGIYCSFTPTLTSNSPVVVGNTITLTASGGATYMWSGPDGFTATGSTVTIPNAAASHAGVYTVNVTNAGGCYASMTTNVLVATDPPVSLCPGDQYTLSVPSGSVGQWHYNGIPIPGATNITYIVRHTAPGVYHFAGTDAQGCSFTSCSSGVFVTGTCPTGSVGNYVWTDTNADGINNEPTSAGINGVTVQLWSATGDTLIATTTTANNGSGNPGYYNFIIDRTGSYYIKFPTTNGINILTTQTTTAATDNNSDANTTTGKSPNFTITVTGTGTAKDNPTIDAGYRVPPTTVNVTVNNAIVCIGGSAILTATPTGGNGTYTYQWQSSNDNVTFSNISGATNATYTAPTTTAGVIHYRAVVTSGGLSANSNSTSVTVIADPSVSVTSSNGATICTGGTTTLTATVTGGSGTISYAWESSLNGSTWSAVGSNSNTYTTPALTATTYYRVTISQSVNGCSVVSTTTIINVVADPTVTVTASAMNVCIGGTAMLTATPSGGTGTASYQWQSSSDNVTFTNISGATNSTYNVLTTSTSTLFYRVNVSYSGAGCGTGTSASTQINVVNDPSVTITSGSTICTGGTVTLTSTVSSGTGTSLYQWQSSSDNITFTDIIGATNASYTTSALTSNTYYRVNVTQNSGCAVSSSSSMITVTADPTVTVTASAMNVCIGGTATLTATPSGGTGTPSYQWQSSSDNVTFTNISGATNSTYSVLTTSTSTLFYRVNISYSGAGCGTGTSASTQINVVSDPSVTITSGSTICTGGTVTLTSTVSSGTGTSLYQWQSSSDNITFTDIIGATNASYTTPALTSNTYYRVNVTQNSGCAVSSSSSMITVTADPTVTVTASAMNVCIGGVATLTASASGGTGTASYQWQSSSDNVTFTNISGATNSTYNVLTTTTSNLYYRVNVSYSGAGCGMGTSASTQINVVSDPSVTITSGSTICTGGTVTLTSTVIGGTGTSLYQWQSSSDNITFTDIIGATNSSYTTPALTSNTYYRVNVSQNSGCAVSSSSSMITVTADPTVTVTASAMNVCIGGVATLTASASGGTGTASYQWQSSSDNVTFTNISGATNSTYNVLTTTILNLYYRVNVSYSGAGCGTGTSASTQINVVSDPSVTITSGSTICTGGTVTLTSTVIGGTGTSLYQWQSSSDNITFTDIIGATNSSYTTPALTLNTYYRVNVTQNSGCAVSSSSSMITVVADPSVSVSGGTTICAGSTATLTTNVTNGTGTTTYQWQSSNALNGTYSDISGATNATYTTPALTTTTYYRVVINQTGNGCGTATSVGVTVTVNPTITITTQPNNITQCIGGTQVLSVVASGTGLTYQWQSSSDNSNWTNISGQTSTTYTPPSTTAGTMYYRVVVSGAPCTAVNSNSATVITNSLLSLGDYVWLDINNNGLQDVGELGIGNVTVNLYADANNDNTPDGAALATTTTNSAGAYTFNNLCNGRYVVSIVVPASYVASTTTATSSDPNNTTANDNNGIATYNTNELRSNSINLTANNLNVDFGLRGTLNLGNLVWFDNDNNGLVTVGENGINAVTIRLYQDANNDNAPDGAAIATTTTNSSGIYEFSNLPNGNYIVGVVLPTGHVATATTANSATPNSDTDNDNNGVTVVSGELRSNAITLAAATEPTTDGDGNNGNLTLDFGVRGALNLGNRVWSDANNNGLLDVGETGIANVRLYLFRDDNGDGIPENSGNPIASTTTDASGNYNFTGLTPGGYMVGIGIPANYIVATVPASGANPDNNTDNDNNLSRITGGYNTTGTVFLTVGGEPTTDGDGNNGNLTVDLALYNPFSACIASLLIDDFATDATIINLTGRLSPTIISGSYTNPNSIGGFLTTTLTGRRTTGNTNFSAATGAGTYEITTSAGDSLGNVMIWDGDTNPALNPTGMSCKNLSPYLTLDFVYGDDRPAGSVVKFELTLHSGTNNASQTTFNYTTGGNGHRGVVSIPLAGLRALAGMSAVDLSCVKAIQLKTDLDGTNNNGWDYSIGQIIACAKTLPASVGDYTWQDLNGNGIQESGEPAMLGVTVTLKDNNGVEITSTTTNASGNYLFTNLSPGTYQIVFTTPSGFNTSPALQGGNTATDSDPVGGIATVTLAAGQNNMTIDAGFVLPCTVANITTQPTAFTECIGGTQTLSVVATGTPLTYQWQSSPNNTTWTNISGATTTTYTPPSTTAGTIYYRVVVTAGACGSVNANSVAVVIVADPSVSVSGGTTVCIGGTATLTANVTNGTGTTTYQWQSSTALNGTYSNISGATNATYTTPSLNITMYYRVIINQTGNGCGSATSAGATVTVVADPSVSVTASATNVCVGGTATLSATPNDGTGTVTYQWQSSTTLGGTYTNISGATNATYNVVTTSASSLYYRVVVTHVVSGCDLATSAATQINVVADPVTTVSATAPNVCNGGTVTISATTNGGVGCTYQWQNSPDGTTWTDIPSATNPTYTTPALNSTTRYRIKLNCTGSGCCN